MADPEEGRTRRYAYLWAARHLRADHNSLRAGYTADCIADSASGTTGLLRKQGVVADYCCSKRWGCSGDAGCLPSSQYRTWAARRVCDGGVS